MKSDSDGKQTPPAAKAKKEKKKKNRTPYIDDGHTVYDMSGLGPSNESSDNKSDVGLSKKEKWAAIRAAFALYLPILLLVFGCFFVAMLIIRLWLHG